MNRLIFFCCAVFMTLIIKMSVHLAGHTIAWIWAALIGFAIVLLLDDAYS